IVACGYADGYPRVRRAARRCWWMAYVHYRGRVSMDRRLRLCRRLPAGAPSGTPVLVDGVRTLPWTRI
ncbi:hypothetical protein NLB25_27880, partial [Klebsiella pneumoniae]|nr:hypothetical protein [Klebsiella pneumoniae]